MAIGIGLQALGAGWQGGDPGTVVKRYQDALDSQARKERVATLLERMNIAGPQRAILEAMPFEQVPGLLWQMQQQEAARRAVGGAAAAKAAEERRAREAYAQMFSNITGGTAPAGASPYSTGVPVNEMPMSRANLGFNMGSPVDAPQRPAERLTFSDLGATQPAQAASPYQRYESALQRLMASPPPPPGTPERTTYDSMLKDLQARRDFFKPEDVEGVDYQLANTYRDDLNSEAEISNFRLVRDGFDTIETLYQNPGAVSDYALAVAFAKIVDPGSVAREGEVAAVQRAPSVSDSLRAQILNALDGRGGLPDVARAEIADIASRFYNKRAERAGGVLDSYRTRAERAKIPFDEIWSGGDISPLPDDWFDTLAKNPLAKERLSSAQNAAPATDADNTTSSPPYATFDDFSADDAIQRAAKKAGVTVEAMWEVYQEGLKDE